MVIVVDTFWRWSLIISVDSLLGEREFFTICMFLVFTFFRRTIGSTVVKCKGLTLALNAGMGAHLSSYIALGLDLRLALEVRDKERENFQRNLGIPIEPFDPRWIYNRKDKGTADLQKRLGGALDVLDVTSSLNAFEEKGKPQNLFDAFGIARRLKPKIVIAYAPSTILQNNNQQRFHSFLDYLRYDNLRNPEKRSYFVTGILVDAANYGAGVSKQYTLIIGLRTDLAGGVGIHTDQAIRHLLPKRTKSGSFHRTKVSDNESAFWFEKTREDQRLAKTLRHLPKSPDISTTFKPTVRLKRELGFP